MSALCSCGPTTIIVTRCGQNTIFLLPPEESHQWWKYFWNIKNLNWSVFSICTGWKDWLPFGCNYMYFRLVCGDKIHLCRGGIWSRISFFHLAYDKCQSNVSCTQQYFVFNFFLNDNSINNSFNSSSRRSRISTHHNYQWQLHCSCCIFNIPFFQSWLPYFWAIAALASLKAQILTFPDDWCLSLPSLLVSCNGCATLARAFRPRIANVATNGQCSLWNTWVQPEWHESPWWHGWQLQLRFGYPRVSESVLYASV